MNKPGSMLVELLISTVIAAMIAMALIGTWYQTQRVSKRLENIIDQHARIGLLHRQLLYDISGAFVPNIKTYVTDLNVAKGADAIKTESSSIEDTKLAATDETTQSSQKNKDTFTLFEGKEFEDHLESVTFITSNPLPGYWDDQVGGARPRVARIMYRLKEDPQHKNSYILYRTEGFILPIADYKDKNESGPQAYPLITGIKNLQFKYVVVNKKESSKNNDEQKDDKEAYQRYSMWPPQKKDGDKEKKDPSHIIPNGIMVSGAMYDSLFKRALPFSFVYTMMTVPALAAKKTTAVSGAVKQVNAPISSSSVIKK